MADHAHTMGLPKGGDSRRDFLLIATSVVGTAGVTLAVWPFIDSMNPAADVLATSTREYDLKPIKKGQRVTVIWRGKPIFIDHRTPKRIAIALADNKANLIDPAPDSARVIRQEWLVVIGICTHLGCIPLGQKPNDDKGPYDGWFCPCHGSLYDTAARVRRGPAPRNLDLPGYPDSMGYKFIDDTTIRIG